MKGRLRIGVVVLAISIVALYLGTRDGVQSPTPTSREPTERARPTPEPVEVPPTPVPHDPGVVLRGRVADAGGLPVAWAEVRYRRGSWISTGPDGAFVFEDLEPGSGGLRVRHGSFLPHAENVSAPALDVVIRLDRGLSVSGRVTTPQGRPVEGVWLHTRRRRAQSGPDGGYRISGLEPGDVVIRCLGHPTVIAHGDGRPNGRGPGKCLRAIAGDTGVDVTVSGRALELVVFDEKDRPLSGAAVVVAMTSSELRIIRKLEGTLDARGRALCVVGLSAKLLITILPAGRSPLTRVVQPDPEAVRVELELHLPAPQHPGALAFTTGDELGGRIPSLFVTLNSKVGNPLPGFEGVPVALDASGRGRLEEVPPGSYEALCTTIATPESEDGFGLKFRSPIQVTPGATTPIDVAIPLGGRLRVTVRGRDGQLVKPGPVTLQDTKGKNLYIPFGYRRGDRWKNGEFHARVVLSLAPIPPGTYILAVRRARKAEERVSVVVHPNVVQNVEIRIDD